MSLSASADPALATVAREAAVDLALAAHRAVRAASRQLPAVERKAAWRASSAACMAAIDEAHDAFRAAVAPSASLASANPFAFHGRLGADRQRLERAAWDANPDLQRIVEGFEHLALPNGEWALVDLTDPELRRLAGAATPVAA